MLLQTVFLAVLSSAPSALAAFGFTQSGNGYAIDAGSSNSLVFTVDGDSCDITSILYRGTELQDSSKGTHLSSGLGSASVTVEPVSGSANYIKVTCTTDTLTHYMVVREGDSTIYLGTFISAEPDIGELRFIARLNADVLSGQYPYGDVSATGGSSSAVEGSDVFVVGDETRSKFYSSTRFIDRDAQCVYGGSDEMHVCTLVSSYESNSGGPFFRDIESNNVGDATHLTWYMNSNHAQTEAYRTNNVLHGPYILAFSRSGIPTINSYDTSFFSELDIQGFVPESDRGYVSGTASGVASGLQGVVHWSNEEAQYWAIASSDGSFTSPAMKSGTYTMVLYQAEYKVATATSISVSAGSTTTQDIASGEIARTSLWKIGEYDGQPTGFRNADLQQRMHPSDSRMSWDVATFSVGSSSDGDFPMALVKGVNDPLTITFDLDSDPGEATLRIATTLAFASGRPQALVNSFQGDAPAAPTKIDSRGFTRGTYRGLGEVYDVTIPSGTLVAGSNTVVISAISGSSGDGFLAPNFIFDCVELFTA